MQCNEQICTCTCTYRYPCFVSTIVHTLAKLDPCVLVLVSVSHNGRGRGGHIYTIQYKTCPGSQRKEKERGGGSTKPIASSVQYCTHTNTCILSSRDHFTKLRRTFSCISSSVDRLRSTIELSVRALLQQYFLRKSPIRCRTAQRFSSVGRGPAWV